MTTLVLRKKLRHYIDGADDKKLKAIYTILEKEIETEEVIWDDQFIKELKRRSGEMKTGHAKTYSWNEMEKAARKMIRAKQQK
ncbi:MAG: hypothetical protein ABL876_12295 [Chitinophagaceae bacterium]